ncbi:acyl-CoA dehydrogenase family protein [Streptomyces goshikiensis]|uniref:acyl-CoA dehydrogenase family protein n=1 Tax=Streptomyces goshikiensis TaxID=1942 RepID=UPI0016774C3B|nr:acyl-CoA dehydrogenase family protein [Streptomyces goshikiensis]GHD76683.1 acyl-CoA dehydrogenase [Streptomyces goshikiensis]
MDFQPTRDQRDLRAGVRELLAGRYGRDALRAAVDGGSAVDRELWRELGAAGFFALRLPEAEGGVGLGLPEAVLVFEEAGRALLPGPLVATHLAAGAVPGAAAGTAVVTAFDLGERGGPLVSYLAEADAVLGAAGLPPGEPVRSADPLTPLHRVTGGGPADVSAYREAGALLTAALQVGSALRTLELAVRYAGEREQFGQPIGAFQAVKHLCAGMLVRAEVARTAVYAAAVTAQAADAADGQAADGQDADGEAAEAAEAAEVAGEIAAAKLLADEAAVRNARDCLQVHGGMGFTWEADVHLHLKRAWVRAEQWVTAAEAEEALAAELSRTATGGEAR